MHKTTNTFWHTFLLFVLIGLTQAWSLSQTQDYDPSYEDIFNDLITLKDRPLKSSPIKNVRIDRDVGTFLLENGNLYQLATLNQKSMALLYVGNGVFSFTPPNSIEQEQLYRFLKKRNFEQKFETLLLFFNDATLVELEKHVQFKPSQINGQIEDIIERGIERFSDEDSKYISTTLMKNILENDNNGYFLSYFYKSKYEPLLFEIDPDAEEEVQFYYTLEDGPELICQFQLSENNKAVNQDLKKYISIESYSVETSIDEDLELYGKSEINFSSLRDNQQWLNFRVYYDMIIDSVHNSSGERVDFFKAEERSVFWLKSNKKFSMNEKGSLTLYYHCDDLLEKDLDAWIYAKSSLLWFPKYNLHKKANYDLTFHYPEKWLLISIGEKIESNLQDGIITERWKPAELVRNASFTLGFFDEHNISEENLPDITILKFKAGHYASNRMEEEVGEDIINSFRFFNRVFGPSKLKHFYVSEIPYGHGEAFPGLIHLSLATFTDANSKGYHEIFRAHEVAHQWWGIGVDYKTYHDKWLSEAFAQYAGLWYMQTFYGDNEKFFDIMVKSKERILNTRNYLFEEGQEAGPIWLGYRTSSSNTSGDYGLVIYNKGAWVLHMLRIMMLDVKTMNEDRFTNMLQDFYKTYHGKQATTENFKRIVEKHIGYDMHWFFKQWIYSAEIPEYKFAYQSTPAEGNKFLIQCKIKQMNVSDDFQMPILFEIIVNDKQIARISRQIKGNITEFKFVLPIEPDEIKINYLNSVLGEFDDVDFDEI